MEREEFERQVRDVLAHLYDIAHLQDHPLCQILLTHPMGGAISKAQSLRRVFLEAIEKLRPGPHISYSSKEWRPYRVLFYRYVQRMSIEKILEELAISERQFQREHAKALKGLSGLLWSQAESMERPEGDGSNSRTDAVRAGSAAEEVQRLVAGAHYEALNVESLLRGVLSAIEKLAASHRATLKVTTAPNLYPIYGDPGLFRQILLNILSHLLTLAWGKSLQIVLDGSPNEVCITFAFPNGPACSSPSLSERDDQRLTLSRQLTEAIGGRFHIEGDSIRLHFPRRSMALLVVDDNQDFIRLVERFLADSPYQVISAQNAEQALALARQIKPFLITLDVMMPSRDGWETLQHLKHNPKTSGIPIVICSVLNEPELAFSLGADDYLKKPITQKELLAVLSRWEKFQRSRSQNLS